MLKTILTPEVLEALLGLMATALTVAAPLLVLYARRAARKVADAAGVQLEEAQLRKLDELVHAGIGAAEEYAKNAGKAGLHYSPRAKLDHAVKIARDLAADGLKAYTDQQLRAATEAKLPVARARMSVPPARTSGLPPVDPALRDRFR